MAEATLSCSRCCITFLCCAWLQQITDESKLANGDLGADFDSPSKAAAMVKLLAFSAFEDTASAVAAAADVIEGRMGKVWTGSFASRT